MRIFVILIFCCFALANCSKVETTSKIDTQTNSNNVAVISQAVSPTDSPTLPLKPVIPKMKLNSEQKKNLNESLPPQVREILEKAEKFELFVELGEQQSELDLTHFQPNVVAKINDDNIKEMILESFYTDAGTDENRADCYEPRHELHAVYEEKTVDVEICFACAKFYVKSSLGNFEGTIRCNNRKSENLFNELIINFGNLTK